MHPRTLFTHFIFTQNSIAKNAIWKMNTEGFDISCLWITYQLSMSSPSFLWVAVKIWRILYARYRLKCSEQLSSREGPIIMGGMSQVPLIWAWACYNPWKPHAPAVGLHQKIAFIPKNSSLKSWPKWWQSLLQPHNTTIQKRKEDFLTLWPKIHQFEILKKENRFSFSQNIAYF